MPTGFRTENVLGTVSPVKQVPSLEAGAAPGLLVRGTAGSRGLLPLFWPGRHSEDAGAYIPPKVHFRHLNPSPDLALTLEPKKELQ